MSTCKCMNISTNLKENSAKSTSFYVILELELGWITANEPIGKRSKCWFEMLHWSNNLKSASSNTGSGDPLQPYSMNSVCVNLIAKPWAFPEHFSVSWPCCWTSTHIPQEIKILWNSLRTRSVASGKRSRAGLNRKLCSHWKTMWWIMSLHSSNCGKC